MGPREPEEELTITVADRRDMARLQRDGEMSQELCEVRMGGGIEAGIRERLP